MTVYYRIIICYIANTGRTSIFSGQDFIKASDIAKNVEDNFIQKLL